MIRLTREEQRQRILQFWTQTQDQPNSSYYYRFRAGSREGKSDSTLVFLYNDGDTGISGVANDKFGYLQLIQEYIIAQGALLIPFFLLYSILAVPTAWLINVLVGDAHTKSMSFYNTAIIILLIGHGIWVILKLIKYLNLKSFRIEDLCFQVHELHIVTHHHLLNKTKRYGFPYGYANTQIQFVGNHKNDNSYLRFVVDGKELFRQYVFGCWTSERLADVARLYQDFAYCYSLREQIKTVPEAQTPPHSEPAGT